MIKLLIKTSFLAVFMFIGFAGSTQTLTTPRPSAAATLSQKIGLTEVTINYSRPLVIRGTNDRTGQIWGSQVPWGLASNGFGNQKPMPWRAGANENTIISFSTPVQIEGEELDAGSYGLHMIPYEGGKVTVIFSNNTSSWGSFWYDESEDALRVDTKMMDSPFTNVLTYQFIDLSLNSGKLALMWESKQIPITIGTDQEVILTSFRNELRGMAGFGWQGPLSAAVYCLNNNINHEEAVVWADRAVRINRSGQTLGVKAALLLQNGDKAAGLKAADEAMGLSNMNELNTLGYRLMAAGELEKAEEFFKLNVEKNPDVANCFDSMGECYVAMGKKQEAIKMFKQALSMDPPANVKANSMANLKKLGVK